MIGLEGPGRAVRHVADLVVEQVARAQVLDPQGEALVAGGVDGVGEQRPVTAHAERAQGEVVVPLGLGVAVEQDLLALDGGVGVELGWRPVAGAHHGTTAVDGVLAALEGARVVPPRPAPDRHGEVGLEDA